MGPHEAADAFAELFPELYLVFHRRRSRDSRPTAQSMAVLSHLAMAGPLTVGELAAHLSRAQSACTEIVDQLQAKGLLARMADARDRRRHLVWLTDAGQALLAAEREVLARDRVAEAMRRMPASERSVLVESLKSLLSAAQTKPRRKP